MNMFTDGLDASAVEWIQGDIRKTTPTTSVLSSPIHVLSPRHVRETVIPGRSGRSWGLPPTQYHSSKFHSGILRTSFPPSPDDMDESVGSISADGHNLDTSDSDDQGSGPYSGESSPKFRSYNEDYENLQSKRLPSKGTECRTTADDYYYEYDKRLLDSKPNSKTNSRCNSRRESFGRQNEQETMKASTYPLKESQRVNCRPNPGLDVRESNNGPISTTYENQNRFDGVDCIRDDASIDDQFETIDDNVDFRNISSRMASLNIRRDSTGYRPPAATMRSGDFFSTNSRQDRHFGSDCQQLDTGASPSAPPMTGPVNIGVSAEDGSTLSTSQHKKENAEETKEANSPIDETPPENFDVSCHASRNAFTNETEDQPSKPKAPASQQMTSTFRLSGHAAWQALLAYDACVRLCLRAWSKGCMEAPEFLLNECEMLRNAFGLQHLLLQPYEESINKNNIVNTDGNTSVRGQKSNCGRIKVQVRKFRIFPRQVLQAIASQKSAAYVQVGAQYVRQVSDMVKTGVKNILNTTSIEPQDTHRCILRLKSVPDETIQTCPGSGDTHFFNINSSTDSLVIDVLDSKGNLQGQVVMNVSVNDEPTDNVRWWPVFNGPEQECVGKLQVFMSYISNSNEPSSKWGPVGETLAYDIVLEVAMQVQNFQRRNLRLDGPWKWLLSEFATFYGVSSTYTSLRYLSCIMDVATPTEDCLLLIYDLLCPIVESQIDTSLSRQEKRMLGDVQEQVEHLVAIVFENYKSLDETSQCGMREVLIPVNPKAAPALVPAVKIFTLLHDILSIEAQKTLNKYFQRAAQKRCRFHMAETDELFTASSEGFLMDPLTTSAAYAKLKNLCSHLCNEVRTDIDIHNEHILPSCVDLPSITAEVYCTELTNRLKSFLSAFPPSGPSPPVVELLMATADFQQHLTSWRISPIKANLNAKDLFHLYIELWIQDRRLHLLDMCKLEKVRWVGSMGSNGVSPFVEEMYDRIKDTLNEYDSLLTQWPEYTFTLEGAIADVETAVISTLEKQYSESLSPLKDVMVTKKFSLQYMQKLTRRRSLTLYNVPSQLGAFLNTIKRLLDTLRPKIDVQMKSWVTYVPVESIGKPIFGERLNEVTVLLRAKYRNFIQAIVEKLADNARLQATTKLKKILQDTREAGGESEIRDRMQPLSVQLVDTITHLHDVFAARVFVAICRAYWDRMGQEVLHFLENRKENRSWYKGSHFALMILDDIFASQMQKLQGHALQEKDVDPPRSVLEARSLLSRDVPNGFDSSSSYLYF